MMGLLRYVIKKVILSDKNQPVFEELVRKICNIALDELSRKQGPKEETHLQQNEFTPTQGGVEINVEKLLEDLSSEECNRRLHRFYSMNQRWIAILEERNRRVAVQTCDFVDLQMPDAVFAINQFRVLESKKQEIMLLDGNILDLGVYQGHSTKYLARIFPQKTIHGFDSFEGLPEDWTYCLKGTFGDMDGGLPDMPENVILYKGWFSDTLPDWLEENRSTPISLLRVDCDLYTSTKDVLNILGDEIKSGTWILFDELIGYKGWEKHEYKAFNEFLEQTGLQFEYIAYGLTYVLGRIQ